MRMCVWRRCSGGAGGRGRSGDRGIRRARGGCLLGGLAQARAALRLAAISYSRAAQMSRRGGLQMLSQMLQMRAVSAGS